MRRPILLILVALLLGPGLSLPAAAEIKPLTYSALFSKARVVAAGTVTGVSLGLLSKERKAKVRVDGLFKGRLPARDIEVAWKEEEHPETGYVDGSRVILFLVMRKDSVFAQVSPGISCWPVEKASFGGGKPVRAVSYEFPLDMVGGIPKGALRETEVVEKALNFQVPKRKRYILVDALLPALKPWRPAKRKGKARK